MTHLSKTVIALAVLVLVGLTAYSLSDSSYGNVRVRGRMNVTNDTWMYGTLDMGGYNITNLDTAISGSINNSDLLDNIDSLSFLRSDADDTYTGQLTVAGNVSGADNMTATYLSGNQTWTHQSYPAACPSSSAITTLGDSVTCTDSWVDASGDDVGWLNVTGDLNSTDVYAGGELQVVKNITVASGSKVCLDGSTCAHYIYYNGTHTVIT